MRIFIAILAVLVALVAGIQIGANPDLPVVGGLKNVFAPDRARIPTDQARDLIKHEYIRPVPDATLTDGSINGMVRALKDPYTHYFNPAQNKAFEQAMSGRYSGVGMAVNQDKRGLLVTFVNDSSPAKAARLRPGDVITEVNGKSIAGEVADAAVAKIKGPAGTSVTLTVRSPLNRAGVKLGAARRVTLKRKQIDLPVAEGRMVRRGGRKIGVIGLSGFVDTAGVAVARELGKLEKRGASAYVLDLRGDPGGRLDQAVAVASLFLSKGMIVATDGRARPRREYDVVKNAVMTADPLVVLVDRGSASASEIVAGALKYRDRALIVGTRTFGKGVFQEVTEFKSGGALSLTVGRYELPGRHFITKSGLSPDLVAVDDPKTRADEALDASLAAIAAYKK